MKTTTIPLTRSQLMARVRGRGNKSTEEKLATLFRKAGIKGWRRHLRLPGTPDFAFPKLRLAIFVDGCFWHGCPRCYTRPGTNQPFWDKKMRDNRARDRRVTRELRARGWSVLRIWSHSLRLGERAVLAKIIRALDASQSSSSLHPTNARIPGIPSRSLP
jgi:DNA mismatch endonuclease (patch repair protein)